MFVAALHGKIPSELVQVEDLVTSNVFGFLKYADRGAYLLPVLQCFLHLDVSIDDVNKADFRFWPVYLDGTEPDLVLRVGNHYLLIEAKYLSSFGQAHGDVKHQVERELMGGQAEAASERRAFLYVTVTVDRRDEEEAKTAARRLSVPDDKLAFLHWKDVFAVIADVASRPFPPNALMARDLLGVLERQGLSPYCGFSKLKYVWGNVRRPLFFASNSSDFAWFTGVGRGPGRIPRGQPMFFSVRGE